MLRITFTLDENRIAASGNKDLYVCITGPDGKPVAVEALGSGMFRTRDGDDKTFTQKVQVQYTQGDNKAASPPLTGTQTLDTAMAVFCDCSSPTSQSGVSVVFDANGKMLSYDNITPTTVEMLGNDGIIAWGSFVDPNPNGGLKLFVAGIPTDIAVLSGKTATYTMLDSTKGMAPIIDSSGSTIGNLNAVNMSINFLSGRAGGTMSMDMTLQGQARNVSAINVSSNGCGPSSFFTLSYFSCSGAITSVNGQGFFAGTNASRAGFAYNVSDSQLGGGQGVAALKQNSLR